jgi:hypothetical protein
MNTVNAGSVLRQRIRAESPKRPYAAHRLGVYGNVAELTAATTVGAALVSRLVGG